VTATKAAFKPDSSHVLMAELQVDENWEVLLGYHSIEGWIQREVKGRLGYDPRLTPICTTFRWSLMVVIYDDLIKVLDNLVPVEAPLVDIAVPVDPKAKGPSNIWILQKEFSGANSRDKLTLVREKMVENHCDCYIITSLDEIAYILNSPLSFLPFP
jgi:hypothetical protein